LAGLYLHIPFCKQACHYCNFHFSTTLKEKNVLVKAIIEEIKLQQQYLNGATVNTIYLGGGTPSLLSQKEIASIFEAIYKVHTVNPNAEITLEANPDDLTKEKLQQLADSPVNRLSIGVQSFFDEDLEWMNRAHNAKEAQRCIEQAQLAGFEDLTIDLIYGAPTTNNERWRQNIEITLAFNIPHISCYSLTVEPNTALAHFVKKGIKAAVEEQRAAEQFEVLIEQLEEKGYEHYEISNFALPNRHARHNSNYWLGASYLGIGPAAHSFNGESRQWNIANNAAYIRAIQSGNIPYEQEILTTTQQYNEYILTTLRTKWGCQLQKIKEWGTLYEQYFQKSVTSYLKKGHIVEKNGIFFLTKKGKLIADRIAMDLFFDISE